MPVLGTEPHFRHLETRDIREYSHWVTKRMLQGVDSKAMTLKAGRDFHFRSDIASTQRLRCTSHRTTGLTATVKDVISQTWRLIFPMIGAQSWALANHSGWALTSRDYLLIPPHESYSFTCDPEARHTQLIDISPTIVSETVHDVFDRLIESLPHPICGPHSKTSLAPLLSQCAHWMQLMRESPTSNLSSLMADTLAHSIVLMGLRDWYPRQQLKDQFVAHQRRRNPVVARAVEYLRAEFADDVTLDALAKAAGMNKFGLCRIFKQFTGETPMRYLFRLRIEAARKQLRSRRHLSRSITEIAFEVGFQDASHFSRIFRAHYGMTPQSYRDQEHRKG